MKINKINYIPILFVLLAFCFSAYAGMRFTELISGNIKTIMNYAVLAITVEVKDVKETDTIRDSGYFEYDDSGDFIDIKEKKILALCNIKLISKNKTAVELLEGQGIVITFWKQVEGPISPNYREGWQQPPEKGEFLLLAFLGSDIKKDEEGVVYMPTFVRNPDVLLSQ
ncbi:hypothetical protein ACFL96_04890 [Thermoproteota archaeon]